MARGKPWTDEEIKVLRELAEQGLSAQEIYESGKLPDRTYEAIRKQLNLGSIVATKQTAIVETIEPAKDALSMEQVVKLFSTAFKQICELQQVDKLTLERFRIIFQAAKDYGPLLSSFQRWEKIEKQIEELAAAVEELQAAKGAKKV
ncbi:MAG: hypothetical protein K6T73_10710 [Candidatus Bathyarchaeota archaeon]|nr:hypothetical protein [Candidatus Bathyarchaeota archaeon]